MFLHIQTLVNTWLIFYSYVMYILTYNVNFLLRIAMPFFLLYSLWCLFHSFNISTANSTNDLYFILTGLRLLYIRYLLNLHFFLLNFFLNVHPRMYQLIPQIKEDKKSETLMSEKHQYTASPTHPDRGPKLQPRQVP